MGCTRLDPQRVWIQSKPCVTSSGQPLKTLWAVMSCLVPPWPLCGSTGGEAVLCVAGSAKATELLVQCVAAERECCGAPVGAVMSVVDKVALAE